MLRFILGIFLLLTTTGIVLAECPFEKLGVIYVAKTEDGVNIKLLRYAPIGEKPNNGSQPILLFSGVAVNMAEYLLHTPENLKGVYRLQLPENLADWAKNDPRIQKDPMLYYSLAYYLWKKGYDVWLVNYRGTGCGKLKSDVGSRFTSLDFWAIYDAKAAIRKVYEITGKNPIIGGHSTAGLVAYVYLQGTKFINTPACIIGEPWCKKVISDENLVKYRNGEQITPETVIGVIAIDPAMIPPLPRIIDNIFIWALLDTALYIDIRSIIDKMVASDLLWSAALLTEEMFFKILYKVNSMYGNYSDIIRALAFTNPGNLNPYLYDFLLRYIADSLYTSTFAQYADFGLRYTVREYFENGGRGHLVEPPKPNPGVDGYYYYIRNMHKVKVPFIAVLSELDGLVDADQVIKDLMLAKSRHVLDRYYIIPNTGHLDLPFGLNAPTHVFPLIGQWLD
ncbi:MAG: lysophospholipase, partial [Archaeoglobaceae archaeon]|nr:lysophospholipase [Archaeoglobaceae archaeon]